MECYSIDLLSLASSEALVFSLVCYRSIAVTFLRLPKHPKYVKFLECKGLEDIKYYIPVCHEGREGYEGHFHVSSDSTGPQIQDEVF